ncbi:MAG: hypothetical protein WAU61_14395 [Smithella sp.]
MTIVLAIVAMVLIMVGAYFFYMVQIRQIRRKKDYYINPFKDLTVADINLLKIGAIMVFLGLLLIAIIKLVVGGPIYFGGK